MLQIRIAPVLLGLIAALAAPAAADASIRPADIVTLAVSSSVPASGATQVARTTSALLTFNATLDAATLTAANISLQGPLGPQPVFLTSAGIQLTMRPSTPLLPLGHYTLTVGTGVRGVLGEQLAAPVIIGFTVTDGHWSAESHLENATGDAHESQIAIDANGDGLAVWSQFDGARYSIFANRYTVGVGWGTPELLEHNDTGDGRDPQIAVGPGGIAVAVWKQSTLPLNTDGSRDMAWSSRYVPGSGWSAAEQIDNNTVFDAELPTVGVDSSGNAVAVWWQTDATGNRNVWANRYTAGAWGTPQAIESGAGLAQLTDLTVNPDGSAMAIWTQFEGSLDFIWTNRFTPAGGWGTPVKVDTTPSNWVADPHVKFDEHGNALAVWMAETGTGRDSIRAARFTPAGGWGAATVLDPTWPNDAFSPRVAIDASGNALAVWCAVNGGITVFASRYTAGGSWGAQEIMSGTSAFASDPKIAMDPTGNALLVWPQENFSGALSTVVARRYVVGAGWGSFFTIQVSAPPLLGEADLAIDRNGSALAVWWRSNGNGFDLLSSRFE